MIIRTFGSTTVYVSIIPDDTGLTRRKRETATVADIIRHALGDDCVLTHDAEGAPHIPGYFISISHSARLAVVAIDPERAVGVDAEEWRPTLHKVKTRFLSDAELSIFTTDEQLLAAWTIKESVFKIVGKAAVEFSTAIAISPDMAIASCCGRDFSIIQFDIDGTHISMASYR